MGVLSCGVVQQGGWEEEEEEDWRRRCLLRRSVRLSSDGDGDCKVSATDCVVLCRP